jgi:hypothetical protein
MTKETPNLLGWKGRVGGSIEKSMINWDDYYLLIHLIDFIEFIAMSLYGSFNGWQWYQQKLPKLHHS